MRNDYILGHHAIVRPVFPLQHQPSIKYNRHLQVKEDITKLQSVHKQRQRIKWIAEDLSLEYRIKLALVTEEAGELAAAVFLCNQNRTEEQKRVSRNIRRMEGKTKESGTNKVTIPDIDGNIL